MDQNLGVIFLSENVINVNIPLRKTNKTGEIKTNEINMTLHVLRQAASKNMC